MSYPFFFVLVESGGRIGHLESALAEATCYEANDSRVGVYEYFGKQVTCLHPAHVHKWYANDCIEYGENLANVTFGCDVSITYREQRG